MFRVLVFPSCNEPGLEIISSLIKSNKIKLYGGSSRDTDYDPARLILSNHIRCPDYGQPDFKTTFLSILQENRIDIVFPTVDVLVAEFSNWESPGTVFVTPNPQTAHLLLSKSGVYRALEGTVPVPKLYDGGSVDLPAFAKPDKGSGSRGSFLISTIQELELAVSRRLLVCEYLPGDEFTVDCVNNLSGELLYANPRIRGKIGRSISLGTRDVSRPQMVEAVNSICKRIPIEGPWFAQFKMDWKGQPRLMEINARVAGSMAQTRLRGVNIPLISVFLYTGCLPEPPRAQEDVLLNRCLRNLPDPREFVMVIWDLDDTIIRKDGKPDPDALACLFDCRNRGIRQVLITRNPFPLELLQTHQIPNFFETVRVTRDKPTEIRSLLQSLQIAEEDCVFVNDSHLENLIIQNHFDGLRTITPDTLEMLGRERLS